MTPRSPAKALRATVEHAKQMHRLYPFTRTRSSAALRREALRAFSDRGFSTEESELLAKCLWLSCRLGKPLSAVAPPDLLERLQS